MSAIKSEFVHDGKEFEVSDEMFKSWRENGYFIIRSLLDQEEHDKVKMVLESQVFEDNTYGREDTKGGRTKVCAWNQLGDDVTGMVSRSNKVAGTAEKLLGCEVYHFHTKLIMKNAFTGGEFVWHQDYGYWYKMGCLFPDMLSVFIAVDKATPENGCLQILPGSHRMGRLVHTKVGGQNGADPERMEYIFKQFPLVNLELDPGDACFFHSNLLHTSAQNPSDKRRWAYIISYNRKGNDPFETAAHPAYTPLMKVPDSAIKECDNDTVGDLDFCATRKDQHVLVFTDTK